MNSEEGKRRSHLNLVEGLRRLALLNSETSTETLAGTAMIAGGHPHPVIDNAAIRVDDAAKPGEVLTSARTFFGEMGRGFSLWVRDGEPEDASLEREALDAGLRDVFRMPQMVIGRRAEEIGLDGAVEVRKVTEIDQVADYWRVSSEVYVPLDYPPEIFAGYLDREGILAPDIAAFLAYLDGEPVAAAMTIVTHGVAGIFWVGCLERARGRGLARACTAAAVNAGLELGADLASLQASPMGRPLYERMGFETLFDYRLLLCSAPRGRAAEARLI